MNTSKLLYNNSDEIINHIISETNLPIDDMLRGNDGDVLNTSNKIRIFCRCLSDPQQKVNYKAERIMDWLGNQKIDSLDDFLDYTDDPSYCFNHGRKFTYNHAFTRTDIQHVNNFLRINQDRIDRLLFERIEQLKEGIKRVNESRYKDACERAKEELFRQKLTNKNKPQFGAVRDFIQQNGGNKHIYLFEDTPRVYTRIVIQDDDIRQIYDEFVEEWEKRQRPKRPIFRDSFMDKLNEFVVYNHERLLDKEEFNRVSSNWGESRLSEDERYNRYVNKFYFQPTTYSTYEIPQEQNIIGFKTESKIRALKNLFPDRQVKIAENTSYFPLKKNAKMYQLHKVSSRNSYIIDLMFVDKLCYLVMINVNTRYLYVELVNQILFGEEKEEEKHQRFAKFDKSADTYLKTLDRLLQSGVVIKSLTFDGEGSFNSRKAQEYYRAHRIEWQTAPRMRMGNYPDFMKKEQKQVKTDPMHSSLGLIDRVIRTLRDMAYNMGIGIITPSIMEELVRQYNNAPHKTLSKYARKSVSPKMVHEDKELESLIVMNICKENYDIMTSKGFYLPKGMSVKLYNEKDGMMKRRSNVQPGKYRVIGFKNGLYEVKGQKNMRQMMPRWKIDW